MAQSSSAVAFVQMAPVSQQPAAFLQSAVPAASPPGAGGAALPQTQTACAAGSSSTAVLAAVGVLAAAVVSGGSRGERRARRTNNVARRFFNFGGGDGEPAFQPKPVFDPAMQLGAMEPLGYFDPLGYCTVGDEDGFRKFRASEIKHGRVCMIASLGLVGQHFAGTGGVVKGSMGSLLTESGVFGICVILVFSAFLELSWPENPDKEPGNFGDPLGFNQYTPDMRMKELNNGRMAMMSVLGIFAAELVTGEDAIQQFGLPGL
ncbi:unnamed protein product [Polarella glacialis]|uniref:Uncharacterized protein n=1 Tax=Polarella glacialis TaxID=89957 RepID=A0A813JSM1_POLGL|nr:unnamed protein product [Polarella glacialis]CAE8683325.1 unnamed protein product [Polarella glacialis]